MFWLFYMFVCNKYILGVYVMEQSIFKKNKRKALSPIVATILLLVVGVILVVIVLSWGKTFTNTSLHKTTSLVNLDILSDKQPFIRFVEAQNGLYVLDYYPPNQSDDINFTIVGYSLLGYNDYIPLEPEYTVNRAGKHYIPLGIVNEEKITISLLLDNGHYLTFKDITNKNQSPSPSDCPAGFVPVPGNALYGTVGNKGGFCVAQYEMKVDENGDGIGDENTSCEAFAFFDGFQYTWRNNKAGCSYTLSGRTIVSSAQGYPLTYISQTDSQLACESIGGHLITNEEWMTLARNIEIVPSNWSSGTVGHGYIYSGHNDRTPSKALAGDTNNDNGYYLTGQTYGYGNQRRTLTLTNGEVVWDLSGNVMEWVNKTQNDFYFIGCDIVDGDGDCFVDSENLKVSGEYPEIYTQMPYLQNIGYKDLFLLNSDYNTDNGVGYFWSYYYGTELGFLRGGSWNAGTRAGILYLNAAYYPSFTSYRIGLRCVVEPV